MSEPGASKEPRIAIKFGASASSSRNKNIGKTKPPSTLGKRSRGPVLRHEPDSEDDDSGHGRHESITDFDASDIGNGGRRGPLVIPRQPNRDWKAELRAQRQGGIVKTEQGERSQAKLSATGEDTGGPEPIQWGLNVKQKESKKHLAESGNNARHGSVETARAPDHPAEAGASSIDPNQEALDILMGGTRSKRQKIVIGGAPEGDGEPTMEGGAPQRSLGDAAEATLEEYEAMPVEEFGAALLRGMGWKEEESKQNTVKEVKRRPNRLGLGASQLKGEEELGQWNHKGSKKSRPRLNDYRRAEEQHRDSKRHRDSYKSERDRERAQERSRHRDSSYRSRDREPRR